MLLGMTGLFLHRTQVQYQLSVSLWWLSFHWLTHVTSDDEPFSAVAQVQIIPHAKHELE
jgi:hypothetical protein